MLRLGLPRWASAAAATWFALHPVHAEAVLFVVNREEVLSSGFYLAALLVLVDRLPLGLGPARPPAGTAGTVVGLAALAFLGLLAKETAATLPVTVAVATALWAPPRGLRRRAIPAVVAPFLALGGYLVLRRAAMGRLLGGDIPWQDNPLVRADLAGRLTGSLVVTSG
jgi:hypothetical protein